MECPIPPDYCQGHRPATNFVTGAGGFLQAVIYGFVGLRYNDRNLTLAPTLPGNASRLTIRGLHYHGAMLTVSTVPAVPAVPAAGGGEGGEAVASAVSITCEDGCTPPLCAGDAGGGHGKELAAGVALEFPGAIMVAPGPC